jgi:hypothetical protein
MQPFCNPRAVAPIDPDRTRPHSGQVPIRRGAQWRVGADHYRGALPPASSRETASTAMCVFVRTTLRCQRSACQWTFRRSCPRARSPSSPRARPRAPDPGVMHALIWEQSGGEPWSFSVSGQGQPRVFPTAQDAIREVRTSCPVGAHTRVGLTGLSTNSRFLTAAMFAPCPNIAFAARQIAQLCERCKTIARFKADPIYCVIAVYRGLAGWPETMFADATKATIVKGDAPNVDMPQDGNFDFNGLASDTLTSNGGAAPSAATVTSDDRERGWSSAPFSAKPPQADTASADVPSHDRSAEASRSPGPAGASATTPNPPGDSPFVPRSSEQRP